MTFPRLVIVVASLSTAAHAAKLPTLTSEKAHKQSVECETNFGAWHEIKHVSFEGFEKLDGQKSNIGNDIRAEYLDESGRLHFASGIVIDEYQAGLTLVSADESVVSININYHKIRKVQVQRGLLRLSKVSEDSLESILSSVDSPFAVLRVPANQEGRFSLTDKSAFMAMDEDLRYISGFISVVVKPSGQKLFMISDSKGLLHSIDPTMLKKMSLRGVIAPGSGLDPSRNPLSVRSHNEVQIRPSEGLSIEVSDDGGAGQFYEDLKGQWGTKIVEPDSFANSHLTLPLMLLTPARLSEMPVGTVLWSISGDRVIVGRNYIDGDTRGGFLAYGLRPNSASIRSDAKKVKPEIARRDFHVSDVISVSTGRLLSTRHVEGLYDILGFMTNDPGITTIGLAVVSDKCKQAIIEQYPELGKIDDSHVNRENYQSFVDEMRRKFGETMSVAQIDQSTFDRESDFDYWAKLQGSKRSSSDEAKRKATSKIPDLYDILGVSRSDSQEEIRNSYRKLAKAYHPDLNPGDKEAEEKFKKINGAYDVLGDLNKRAYYDRFGRSK